MCEWCSNQSPKSLNSYCFLENPLLHYHSFLERWLQCCSRFTGQIMKYCRLNTVSPPNCSGSGFWGGSERAEKLWHYEDESQQSHRGLRPIAEKSLCWSVLPSSKPGKDTRTKHVMCKCTRAQQKTSSMPQYLMYCSHSHWKSYKRDLT